MGSPATSPPASLLTIPCELRNAVYYYVYAESTHAPYLVESEPDNLAKALQLPPTSTASENLFNPPNNLSLLLTCRQIHAEAHALALHHTPFHIDGAYAEPECFATIAAPLLAANKLRDLRRLTLHAKIGALRALNERWNGLPFGHAGLRLHTLTLVPRKPECHAHAYAEVADLSQSHTLAYIVAETAKTLRQVGCLVVKNESCWSRAVWSLVYRSLVYRIWRWAGPVAGLRFSCSPEDEREGEEWLRIWIGEESEGEEDGSEAREVGEEVVRLVGGKGEAQSVEDIPGL